MRINGNHRYTISNNDTPNRIDGIAVIDRWSEFLKSYYYRGTFPYNNKEFLDKYKSLNQSHYKESKCDARDII